LNHNNGMKASILVLFLCAAYFFGGFITSAYAQDNQEFELKKKNLEDRYEDYYTRQVLLQREALEREKGTQERTAERIRENADYEKARQQYVLERPKKVEVDDKMHEREIAERKKEYERNREEFVRRMQTLKRLEAGELMIPGEEELGINVDPENL
jgi:hypothetical protein